MLIEYGYAAVELIKRRTGIHDFAYLDDSLYSDGSTYEALQATWKNYFPLPTKADLETIRREIGFQVAMQTQGKTENVLTRRESSWQRIPTPLDGQRK